MIGDDEPSLQAYTAEDQEAESSLPRLARLAAIAACRYLPRANVDSITKGLKNISHLMNVCDWADGALTGLVFCCGDVRLVVHRRQTWNAATNERTTWSDVYPDSRDIKEVTTEVEMGCGMKTQTINFIIAVDGILQEVQAPFARALLIVL